ncbi:tRNA-queuosine alpha-mannosyltransferase domain-containing protein [Candidatus Uabimicrobium amorphum]|uniref:tRNA-queuosine alpha-mannosyltransferase n=1 Tax=Uabimicrobium amorphum TaxID=2596890 RepID=A0A5S9IMS3_UABAM|nr:DUF3524 domain-containing protein [Candidatus Uabimicrobium amorphum]BBM83425.1 glycosyl transferase family 1 [Candidatus Uabimicrobium amorphum]
MKKLLFLEPFYGGSHKDFADGWIQHSRHQIDLVTLPARFWKWRLRMAALYFVDIVDDFHKYDALICTSMMSISELKNHCQIPIFLYMHESQLSYPLPKSSKVDHHGIHIDFSNCLAADWLVFNSHTHMSTFIDHIDTYFARVPEYPPHWIKKIIMQKAQVLHPGCQLKNNAAFVHNKRPMIIWNHRWEFDKNPEEFFRALSEIDGKGYAFDIVLLGECGQDVPKPFIKAKDKWGERVLHYGFVDNKNDYITWLQRADLVISTALQENFGISVVEAMYYGCFPLLPHRLSYPEVLPREYHKECLYKDFADLIAKMEKFLQIPERRKEYRQRISQSMAKHSWEKTVEKYDAIF